MPYCVIAYPNRITFSKSLSRSKRVPSQLSKRGKIKTFTRSSYNRLKKFIFSISSPLNFFITLTYPQKFPHASISKKHLHEFFVTLRYYFPKFYFVWKLEPQDRGAPHFHLLGDFGLNKYNKKIVRRIQKLISRLWYQIVNSGDEKHLKAGTQVKYLPALKKDFNASFPAVLGFYIAKYFSKTFEAHPAWDFPGRFWGVYGRKYIKTEVCKFFFTSKNFYFLFRLFKNFLIARLYQKKRNKILKRSKRFLSQFYRYSFSLLITFYDFLSFLKRLNIRPLICRFYTFCSNFRSLVVLSS